MVVSFGKEAVFNQAMLYSTRKPVTVLKDEQMMTIWQVRVSATRFYTVCIIEHKRRKNKGWFVNSVAIMISLLVSLMIIQVSSLHERYCSNSELCDLSNKLEL